MADKKNLKKNNKSKIATTNAKGKFKKWLEPDNLLRLQSWARDGLTDIQIAKNIGIHRDTLYTWKNKYPVINDTLKNGKEVVDIQVENALLKRALGFKEKVRKPMKIKVNRDLEEVVYVDEETYYPPDTTAQIFWLKNRRPNNWRNNDRAEAVEENTEQSNIHKATIDALKSRKVQAMFDDEVKEINNE